MPISGQNSIFFEFSNEYPAHEAYLGEFCIETHGALAFTNSLFSINWK